MAVTIEDIAREAGVSIATVSRVINKTKPVSAELRDRVYEVIEKNHFKPNSLAQGLTQRRPIRSVLSYRTFPMQFLVNSPRESTVFLHRKAILLSSVNHRVNLRKN